MHNYWIGGFLNSKPLRTVSIHRVLSENAKEVKKRMVPRGKVYPFQKSKTI